MNDKGLKTGAVIVEDNTEILGVNDRKQLEQLTSILQKRINEMHMKNGVTIESSNTICIHDNVKIGRDTVIHPNTVIKSGVVIGDNCEIGPFAFIGEDSIIKDNTVIKEFEKIK